MKRFKKTIASVLLTCSFLSTAASAVEQPSNWAEVSISRLQSEKRLDTSVFKDYKENITRSEFAYLIYNLYEEITEQSFKEIQYKNPEASFTDTDDYYVKEVAKSGIISGYGSGLFGPHDKITREQMAKLYINMLKEADANLDRDVESVSFKDSWKVSPWAMESVKISNKMGIIQGVGENLIDPQGNSTKEASLVVYTRIVDKFTDSKMGKNAEDPVYRALLIGNQNYDDKSLKLNGTHNDLNRMESTFAKSYFGKDDTAFSSIVKETDLKSSEIPKAIKSQFKDVKSSDITYFYYSGHGVKDKQNRSCLVGTDGKYLPVDELEKALNSVPGKKVVVIDACNSGGFISKDEKLGAKKSSDFNEGVIEVFRSRLGYLNSNSYKVITSASSDELSYEYRYPEGWGGEFTRNFTSGAGYEAFQADKNADGNVSMNEMHGFLQQSMKESNVQVFPRNDSFTIASEIGKY